MNCTGRDRIWNGLRAIAAVVVAGILAGCGGGSSGNASPSLEAINGITVPPVPDDAANRATVAGVDIDRSGVRDDIDRLLATEFGDSPATHQSVVGFAQTLQNALTNPTAGSVEQHIALIRCERVPQRLADYQTVTLATLDVPSRRRAYSIAFAGVVLTRRGCP